MGGKLSKKKKYNVNDEKAKDKDKKAEGAGTEEEGTLKENETQAAAETPGVEKDKEENSMEPAPPSKETPAVTEAPRAAPAAEVKPAETPAANSDQTLAVKDNKNSLWRKEYR
uniref:Brain acid soluble protein 1 n=1 Tax=Catagonus wagneri TaxID=51154 RepID=A0A8C3WPD5_9CETA